MRVAQASRVFEGSVHEAETVWYDPAGWPRWVDGLARVESIGAQWPAAGAQVRWQSGPAGRGSVSERVVAHEPRGGQTLEVEDDSIRGTQSVSFSPRDGGVAVALRLAYELKARSPLMALVNLLFIRRAMARSLAHTLARFGAELEAARRQDEG